MVPKRTKPGSGGFRPQNTLNERGAGYSQLSTVSSVGSNVALPSTKRQKREHDFIEENDVESSTHNWFDRHVEEPLASLGRRPSIISVNSQGHDKSSQNTRFGHAAFDNVNHTLAPKKRSRKPKLSASQENGSSQQPQMDTDVVSVTDDDDEIEILRNPSVSQSARKPLSRSMPRVKDFQSSPARSPPRMPNSSVEVESSWTRQYRTQQQNSKPAKGQAAVVISPPTNRKKNVHAPEHDIEPERLNSKFVRDEEGPLHSRQTRPPSQTQAQPRMRDRMLSSSISIANPNSKPTTVDLSEDELAGGGNLRHLPQESTRASMRRRSSLEPTTSAHFSQGRRKATVSQRRTIPMQSLYTKAGQWTSDSLYLVFSPEHKAIQFHNLGKSLRHAGLIIELGAQHMKKVITSDGNSVGVMLGGVVDTFSSGKIWCDFNNVEDHDDFLSTIKFMNRQIEHHWQVVNE